MRNGIREFKIHFHLRRWQRPQPLGGASWICTNRSKDDPQHWSPAPNEYLIFAASFYGLEKYFYHLWDCLDCQHCLPLRGQQGNIQNEIRQADICKISSYCRRREENCRKSAMTLQPLLRNILGHVTAQSWIPMFVKCEMLSKIISVISSPSIPSFLFPSRSNSYNQAGWNWY